MKCREINLPPPKFSLNNSSASEPPTSSTFQFFIFSPSKFPSFSYLYSQSGAPGTPASSATHSFPDIPEFFIYVLLKGIKPEFQDYAGLRQGIFGHFFQGEIVTEDSCGYFITFFKIVSCSFFKRSLSEFCQGMKTIQMHIFDPFPVSLEMIINIGFNAELQVLYQFDYR